MKALGWILALVFVSFLVLPSEAYGPIEAIRNAPNRKECASKMGFVIYAQLENSTGWIIGYKTVHKGKEKKDERIAIVRIYGRGFHPVRYEKYMKFSGPINRDWMPENLWDAPTTEVFYSSLNELAMQNSHLFYQCHFPAEILYANPQHPYYPSQPYPTQPPYQYPPRPPFPQ